MHCTCAVSKGELYIDSQHGCALRVNGGAHTRSPVRVGHVSNAACIFDTDDSSTRAESWDKNSTCNRTRSIERVFTCKDAAKDAAADALLH